jgi:hypothetical protein
MFRQRLARTADDFRGTPLLLLVLTLVGCSSVVFGISFAVAAISASDDADSNQVEHGGGPVTNRVEVAQATFPDAGGTYRLLYSRDASGASCVGIETRPPEGPVAIAEGCGGPEKLNIAQLKAPDRSWTILAGKTPESAATLTIRESDHTERVIPTRQDDRGISGRFVLARIDGSLDDASASASTSAGDEVASQLLP